MRKNAWGRLLCAAVTATLAFGVVTPAWAEDDIEIPQSDRMKVGQALLAGGPVTQRTAEAALLGSADDIREYLANGLKTATQHDVRLKASKLIAGGGRKVREATAKAMAGTPEQLTEFLKSGWQAPREQDNRVRITQIMNAGGSATRRAAQAALNGSEYDREQFLATGQFPVRDQDERVKVTQLMSAGGPEVKRTAGIALQGGPDEIREYLAVGQHVARERDQEVLTISQLVDMAKEAGDTAAKETETAKEASEQAVQAAALAKEAAERAARETAEARDNANKASAAAGRAADAASGAANAASVAVGAAAAANNAARVAANAAARAASAATLASQAASRAYNAASAAATNKDQATAARAAAQEAYGVAAGAKLAAVAAGAAGDAAKASGEAATAAANAAANADRAADAALQASQQSNVAGAEADRARKAAADAKRYAQTASSAARQATDLANQAAQAAYEARAAANAAATHAENAAKAAIDAADAAEDAAAAAKRSTDAANAASTAADTATSAATRAAAVEKQAREADQQRLVLMTRLKTDEAAAAKAEYDRQPAEPLWDDLEETRVNPETRQLLTDATAPGVARAVAVSKARKASAALLRTGGRWTKQIAFSALTGTDDEALEFLSSQRNTAGVQDDRARVSYLADTGEKPELKKAAVMSLTGDTNAVRSFLTTQHYEGKFQNDRLKIAQIMDKGGSATKAAAARALNGTEADQHEFLRKGQHVAKIQDERVAASAFLPAADQPLTEVGAAAQIALAGPPSYVTEFLQVGRFKAERRDKDTSTHVARVKGYVADAAQIAATAQKNAFEAQRVAAIARNAAADAERYAKEAQASATQAAEYAKQANQSAVDAQASADQAAESARQARAAEAQANQSAREASNSAAQAENSAAQARSSAALANTYAAQARASAVEAGKEADEAARLASAALTIATDLRVKEENEQREQDEAFKNYEVPETIEEFDNGTSLYYLNGACHLNGVKLPSSLGTGSCVGLVHDFDVWLAEDGSNIDFFRLENDPLAAELLLQAYCGDRPEACGGTLRDQLNGAISASPGAHYVVRYMENGVVPRSVTKPISRLLGFAVNIPRFSKVPSGPFRVKLNEIAKHITERDLTAAARELKGEIVAVKRNGVPWNHVHEVRDAQNGLLKVIDASKKVLNNPGKSAAEKAAAQADLSRASKMLDLAEKFVPR